MGRQNYTAVAPDPESLWDTAAPLLDPGTVVWKNGRAYLYVTFDNTTGNPAVPAKGGLVYKFSAATWGAATGYNVVAGKSGLADATNSALHPAGMVIGTQTKGNYGFVQVRGMSFTPLFLDSGVTLLGQCAGSNAATNATPERAVLQTSGNVSYTEFVARVMQTPAGNSGNAELEIGAYA